jgi:hypothetical protein
MAVSAQASYLAQKSLGPWLSAWAIRSKWKLDYRLSAKARVVRWAVVILCYSFAARATFAAVRVSGGLIGLGFLCWPNFAYHVTRVFETWPTTEGTISSTYESASQWFISYSFEFKNQLYGGTSKVRRIEGLSLAEGYPAGRPVIIRYDPLNPDNSAIKKSSASAAKL